MNDKEEKIDYITFSIGTPRFREYVEKHPHAKYKMRCDICKESIVSDSKDKLREWKDEHIKSSALKTPSGVIYDYSHDTFDIFPVIEEDTTKK